MSKDYYVWIRRSLLVGGVLCLILFPILVFIERRGRETDFLKASVELSCTADSSAQLIANAWASLDNDNVTRALACSLEVINKYSYEALAQQRELGAEIPADPGQYPVLNDVGTAWFIQGEAVHAITEIRPLRDYETRHAQAAYQFALSRYPSAYALYEEGGYWPVRQAAFCCSHQHFPRHSARLPAVYTDLYDYHNCYVPSGFMPEKEKYDTVVDPGWRENPHSGETCMQIKYSAASAATDPSDWGEGVYMQYPENNWGDERGLDLTEASALTFWARGEHGGEIVEFKVGGINAEDKRHSDTFEYSMGTVTLETEWQQYEIAMENFDRSCVIGAFAWVVTASNNPNGVTFYLDDIVFVRDAQQ